AQFASHTYPGLGPLGSENSALRAGALSSDRRCLSFNTPKDEKLSSSPDGQSIHLNRRHAHAYWNRLSILTAGSHAFIELQIVADHRDSGKHIRPVADQRCVFHWRRDLAVFDQIGL